MGQGPDARPQWMRTLQDTVTGWLQVLPKQLQLLRRTGDALKDPLWRCFEREVTSAAKLLADVRRDLEDVLAICVGIGPSPAPPFSSPFLLYRTHCTLHSLFPQRWATVWIACVYGDWLNRGQEADK